MKNLMCLLLFLSFTYSQCEENTELQCVNNENCNWIENITQESCYYTFPSYSECIANGCLWYSPGTYGYMGSHCYGSYYVDNSYCEESTPPPQECSEMSEAQCNINEVCEWVEDVEYGNCSDFSSQNSCNNISECNWECIQYGWWYNWCYTYGCEGGAYQNDSSYCEESDYQMGDINSDFSINVLDVIETITLILGGEYNYIVDMNYDEQVNVLDIIQIVSLILDYQ